MGEYKQPKNPKKIGSIKNFLVQFPINRSASSWLRITPWGIRRMLNWIKDRYNNPDIIITENGLSDRNGYLDDMMRIYF